MIADTRYLLSGESIFPKFLMCAKTPQACVIIRFAQLSHELVHPGFKKLKSSKAPEINVIFKELLKHDVENSSRWEWGRLNAGGG